MLIIRKTIKSNTVFPNFVLYDAFLARLMFQVPYKIINEHKETFENQALLFAIINPI